MTLSYTLDKFVVTRKALEKSAQLINLTQK